MKLLWALALLNLGVFAYSLTTDRWFAAGVTGTNALMCATLAWGVYVFSR